MAGENDASCPRGDLEVARQTAGLAELRACVTEASYADVEARSEKLRPRGMTPVTSAARHKQMECTFRHGPAGHSRFA